jgi:haloalkane dehalogenase
MGAGQSKSKSKARVAADADPASPAARLVDGKTDGSSKENENDGGGSAGKQQREERKIPAVTPRYEKQFVTVTGPGGLRKKMGYYEVNLTGDAGGENNGATESETERDTIVFVHGNPTSSYMWRNVLGSVEDEMKMDGGRNESGPCVRLLALDLIGYGESDKLDVADVAEFPAGDGVPSPNDRYSLMQQCRWFSAWMEAVGADKKNVILVGHSWGGTICAYWGSREENRDAVKGLVSLEVVYQPFPDWDRVPKKIRGGVKLMLRKPFKCCCLPCLNVWPCDRFGGEFDLGAFLILKKNLMLESMSDRVHSRDLDKSEKGGEMEWYRKGFTEGTPESRRPILTLVRSIPVAGHPAEVVDIMDRGREWIVEQNQMPILFLSAEPGTLTEEDRGFFREGGEIFSRKNGESGDNKSGGNVTEVSIQNAGHMATEDDPEGIGRAIARWYRGIAAGS